MEPVYVADNPHEKAMQRALIQYRNPKNYDLVREALTLAGRTDLIGSGKKCLIGVRNFAKQSPLQKSPAAKKQGQTGRRTAKQEQRVGRRSAKQTQAGQGTAGRRKQGKVMHK